MAFTSYVITKKYIDPYKEPFYVEDISGSENTLEIKTPNSNPTYLPEITVYKSYDKTNWSLIGTTAPQTTITATIPANGRIYLRCKTSQWSYNDTGGNSNYHYINATGQHNVGGNICSLIYGDDFNGQTVLNVVNPYYFRNIFSSDIYLISAEKLLVGEYCQGMFSGCTSLTTAPELPTTTLTDSCYSNMFSGCSSLTTAPELPATTLAPYCYSSMFFGCSSLTTAPELPATTLANACYRSMFYNCTSLNSITCLATDISASDCISNWVKNVANTGTFTKADGMTSWPTATSSNYFQGIPSGWTVQDHQG